MRLIIDTLLALLLILVLGGILWYQRGQEEKLTRVAAVQEALRAIESKALYHGALGDVQATRRGYALRIEPGWFDPRPVNLLFADEARPWIDIVDEASEEAFNPARIVAAGSDAAFWYNPWRGVIRARVPMQLSQTATVELYNLVNGASLRVQDVDWSEPPIMVQADAADQVDLKSLPRTARPAPQPDAQAEAPSLPTSKLRRVLGE